MRGKFRLVCVILLMAVLHTGHRAFPQKNKAQIDSLAQAFQNQVVSGSTSVYLRTNKNTYETMEDLWFKAYVLDAQSFLPSDTDRTLYVELKSQTRDSAVYQGKFLIENGIVQGHIYIPGELTEGNYILSAYSSGSYQNRNNFHSFRRVRIIRDLYSLQNTTKSGEEKNPLPKQARPEFTLFPEGGYLVAGINSKIAFKAIDSNGVPAEVKGKLLADGIPVQDFKSLYNGMGSFSLTPRHDKTYSVSVRYAGLDTILPCPKVLKEGIVMQLVDNSQDTLKFKIAQKGRTDQDFYLRIQTRGVVQLIASGVLKDSLIIKLPVTNVPNGIAEATIFDKNFRPVAERLVNISPYKQINITASTARATFGKREKIKVKIKTTDYRGQPLPAHLGVTVFDDIYENRLDTKNILTHYLLETQLKGRVFNAGHYFDPYSTNRGEKLDNLLLTQGWRSYIWAANNLPDQKRESGPSLPDTLTGRLLVEKKRKKNQSNSALMLLSQDVGEGEIVLLDSKGEFTLTHHHLIRGKQLYLKCFGEDDYKITFPNPFAIIDSAKIRYTYSEVCCQEIVNKEIDSTMLARIAQGGRTLKEVVIRNRGNDISPRGKQMGLLDSLARLGDGNTDYVGDCGWLNCPAQASGPRPIEGRQYPTLIGEKRNQVTSHPYAFDKNDFKVVTYRYPKFTDEEVLRKLRLTSIQGYDSSRDFYKPDYETEENSTPDFRNTLYWSPEVNTDERGEVTIEFFSSDITGNFVGIIEGFDANGQLGKSEFTFSVN